MRKAGKAAYTLNFPTNTNKLLVPPDFLLFLKQSAIVEENLLEPT